MDDGVSSGSAPSRVAGKRAAKVGWTQAVEAAVLAGTRDGLVLRQVCAGAGMPCVRTVVARAAEEPAFGAALRAAREAAGLGLRGRPRLAYCAETGEAICARLCAGEAMVQVLRDVEMPGYSTVYRWLREERDFREGVGLARDVQGLRLAELGWEAACAVTPETAYATRVKLEHLRWYAGKLAPKKYGAIKAADPAAGRHQVMHVYTKRFTCNDDNEGSGRWSDEPAKHLYSMIPVGEGERGGEPLPPPSVVREPFTTQGPNATGHARGGGVEVEFEDEGEADGGWEDDYWG
jgi:hypothetical protein